VEELGWRDDFVTFEVTGERLLIRPGPGLLHANN
jgi:hypothetical protein